MYYQRLLLIFWKLHNSQFEHLADNIILIL